MSTIVDGLCSIIEDENSSREEILDNLSGALTSITNQLNTALELMTRYSKQVEHLREAELRLQTIIERERENSGALARR